jgi:hypothetical protein
MGCHRALSGEFHFRCWGCRCKPRQEQPTATLSQFFMAQSIAIVGHDHEVDQSQFDSGTSAACHNRGHSLQGPVLLVGCGQRGFKRQWHIQK